MHSGVTAFSENSKALMQDYEWPGNIRQLANTIERAVILEDNTVIHSANLALPETGGRPGLASKAVESDQQGVERKRELGESLAEQEKELILRILEECLWVQKNAAAKLGISPRALNYKINKLGITHPHWRRNKQVGD